VSEIFAIQLTAVATLGLAAFALATAILAYMAWRKQSREVSDQADMLKLQAKELRQVSAEREQEAQERHRAQAAKVYVWEVPAHVVVDGEDIPEVTIEARVRNTSMQPIYDIRFEWGASATGVRVGRCEPIMMPDAMASDRPDCPPGGGPDPSDAAAAVTFRDRAGVWWRARAHGEFEELSVPPADTTSRRENDS
jgi:hypothetical protein